MISTAITMTVLSHPFQVVLMAMVVGKLIRMGLSGGDQRSEGERRRLRVARVVG